MLAKDTSHGSVVDKVFKQSLKEFHTFLISTYSLSLQVLRRLHGLVVSVVSAWFGGVCGVSGVSMD